LKTGEFLGVPYRMLNKSSIDTARLYQISKIMKVDFFRYYSEALASTG